MYGRYSNTKGTISVCYSFKVIGNSWDMWCACGSDADRCVVVMANTQYSRIEGGGQMQAECKTGQCKQLHLLRKH